MSITSTPIFADFITQYSYPILWCCAGLVFLGLVAGLYHVFQGMWYYQKNKIKLR